MKTLSTILLVCLCSYAQAQFQGTVLEQMKSQSIILPDGFNGVNEEFLLDSIVCVGRPEQGSELATNSKTFFTYDLTGNVDTFASEVYDVNSGMLTNKTFTAISYPNDTVVSKAFVYNFDMQAFEPNSIVIDKLNEEGKTANSLVLLWDQVIMDYKNDRQLDYEYDSNGVVTLFQLKIWDEITSQWINNFRTLTTTNNTGTITETLNQVWEASSPEWIDANRTINSLRNDSIIVESIFQTIENGFWQNARLDSFFFTDEGTRIFNNNYIFDFNLNDWALNTREYFLYQDGFSAGGFIQVYNGSMFINSSRFTSNLQIEEGNPFTIESQYELWENDAWALVSNCNYFWTSREVVSVKEPAFEFNYLEMANPYLPGSPISLVGDDNNHNCKIKLFDLYGKLHFEKEVFIGSDFSINKNLGAGMYLITVSHNDDLLFSKKVFIPAN